MNKVNLFIVGAPRCGTTSLYSFLKQHPDIFFPSEKELNFFNYDYPKIRFVNTIKDYQELYKHATTHKIRAEASVSYIYSQTAAQEIKKYNPEAKIIIMLRNPIDFAYSFHAQALYNLCEDIGVFEEALSAEKKRLKGERIPAKCEMPWHLYYTEGGKYYQYVERYFSIYGKERVHVIIFDNFINDTDSVYGSALEFLGVDSFFRPEFKKLNPGKTVKYASTHRLLHSSLTMAVGKTILPRKYQWKIAEFFKAINSCPSKRPPMKSETRSYLKKVFKGDVEKLGTLLNRDLSFWMLED